MNNPHSLCSAEERVNNVVVQAVTNYYSNLSPAEKSLTKIVIDRLTPEAKNALSYLPGGAEALSILAGEAVEHNSDQ